MFTTPLTDQKKWYEAKKSFTPAFLGDNDINDPLRQRFKQQKTQSYEAAFKFPTNPVNTLNIIDQPRTTEYEKMAQDFFKTKSNLERQAQSIENMGYDPWGTNLPKEFTNLQNQKKQASTANVQTEFGVFVPQEDIPKGVKVNFLRKQKNVDIDSDGTITAPDGALLWEKRLSLKAQQYNKSRRTTIVADDILDYTRQFNKMLDLTDSGNQTINQMVKTPAFTQTSTSTTPSTPTSKAAKTPSTPKKKGKKK